MSVSLTPEKLHQSKIYNFIEKNDFESAEICIENLDSNQFSILCKNFNGKSCFHLLLENQSKKSQELLDKILKNAEGHIGKFQELFPFQYTLEQDKQDNFNYLLEKRIDLLTKNEFFKCLQTCINNDQRIPCEVLLQRLKDKNIELIIEGSPSPFIQSIEKNRLKIFTMFLPYIHEAVCANRSIFSALKKKNINILHTIAKQSDEAGTSFLSVLWKFKLPKLRHDDFEKQVDQFFSSEIIQHINDVENGKTPVALAAECGSSHLVQMFLQYGASPELNGKKLKDLVNKEEIKMLLSDAEYGLFDEPENIPSDLIRILKKRRETGLLRSCQEGEFEKAKILITKYQVDPSITDKNQNSLIMILLKQNIEQKEIIKFIDFLGNDKINYKENRDNDSLLTLAISNDKTEVALHLISKYSDKFDVNHVNNDQQTASIIAAKRLNISILEAILEKYKNIKLSKTIIFSLIEHLIDFQTKCENLDEKKEIMQKKWEKKFKEERLKKIQLNINYLLSEYPYKKMDVIRKQKKLPSVNAELEGREKFVKTQKMKLEKLQSEISKTLDQLINASSIKMNDTKFSKEIEKVIPSYEKKLEELTSDMSLYRDHIEETKTLVEKELKKAKQGKQEEEES